MICKPYFIIHMSTREQKRTMKAAKQAVATGLTNPLMSSCHDYANPVGQLSLMLSEEEFPSYPATPCKPPASKKALLKDECAVSPSNSDIVDSLSKLINTRSDAIEKIGENSMKIEGLKLTIDFACKEIKNAKKRIEKVEKCLKKEEEVVAQLKDRVTELENYSRRWNLKLHGLPESVEDVKMETIKLLRKLEPSFGLQFKRHVVRGNQPTSSGRGTSSGALSFVFSRLRMISWMLEVTEMK